MEVILFKFIEELSDLLFEIVCWEFIGQGDDLYLLVCFVFVGFNCEFFLQGLDLLKVGHMNFALLSLEFNLNSIALCLILFDILIKLGLLFSSLLCLRCCFHYLHTIILHLLKILSMLRFEELLFFLKIL